MRVFFILLLLVRVGFFLVENDFQRPERQKFQQNSKSFEMMQSNSDSEESWISDIRQAFLQRIQRVIHEPSASFFSGLFVGIQPYLPVSAKNDFRKTGLIHILVVSGSNVSLVIVFLNFLLQSISRKKRFYWLIVAVVFYVAFSGFTAPAIRAGIMGSFTLLAFFFGRARKSIRFLIIAAFFMLMIDPSYLFDFGFLLSFSSTAGILLIYPVLESFLKLESFWSKAFFLTIAVEIASLPILFLFGQFSLIAPITNVIFLPFIPFFLLFGIFVTVFSFFAPIFEFCVSLFLSSVHFFAGFSWASIEVPQFSVFATVLYYAVLFIVFRKSRSVRY